MREDRRTRVSLAAPPASCGECGWEGRRPQCGGTFHRDSRGWWGRKAAVPRAEGKDARFDKEEVLQDCREYIPAHPHLHLLAPSWEVVLQAGGLRSSTSHWCSLCMTQLGQEIVLGRVRKGNSTCVSCPGLGSAEHVSADCFSKSGFYRTV